MYPRQTALFLVLGLTLAGCGGKTEEMPPLYPAKGKMIQGGKAVQGGFIQFKAVNEQAVILTNGEVGKDGTFELFTIKGGNRQPGAPEGTYHVTYSPPSVDQQTLPVTLAKTYKVEAKANEFTIEIGSPRK